MKVLEVKLNEHYPFLKVGEANASMTAYLQYDIVEDPGSPFLFKRPLMVVCPGGGYACCSKREGEVIGLHFLKCGFNVLVMEYSCAPVAVYPQALRELCCAIDYAVKNADEWNIDTKKIAVCGFSAGGHLAASYCTMRNLPEITDVIKPVDIQACVLGYPVITADPDYTNRPSIINLTGDKEFTPEKIEKFSLENHISSELTPPTYIWHTANDDCVPVECSLRYATALSANKVPFELHIFPDGRHGLATCDRQTNADYKEDFCTYTAVWLEEVTKWIRKLFDI